MALRIINIHNGSEPRDECIMLKAYENINLDGYAIVERAFLANDAEYDKKIRHIYNFQARRVKEGEYVLLVTGTGTDKKYVDIEGDTIHKFYWNSEVCLWNGANEAILIHYQVMSQHEVSAKVSDI